jgi:hypothetical protein
MYHYNILKIYLINYRVAIQKKIKIIIKVVIITLIIPIQIVIKIYIVNLILNKKLFKVVETYKILIKPNLYSFNLFIKIMIEIMKNNF